MIASTYVSAVRGILWRTMHLYFTNLAILLPSIVFPLFFFIAFAGGLATIGDAPNFDYYNYTAFQFVFVLIQSAAFGGVFTGFALAADFEGGIGRRLMLALPHRSALLVGYGLSGLLRFVVTAVMLTGIAVAAGMPIDGKPVDLLGLYGLAALVNICAAMWGIGLGLRFKSIQAGPIMQMPVFLTLFLAPVYVPYGLLVGWIKAVASVNPFTAVFDAGRSLMAGNPASVVLAFSALAGMVVVFVLWGMRSQRKAEVSA